MLVDVDRGGGMIGGSHQASRASDVMAKQPTLQRDVSLNIHTGIHIVLRYFNSSIDTYRSPKT